jgi:predicted small secreted protein|tara:strand:+ start:513 stop:764 length:252 start_codon:yes stop_codon:yes gene_type:complete
VFASALPAAATLCNGCTATHPVTKNKLVTGMAALKKVNRNISPFVKIGASLCRSYFTPELAIKPTTQTAFNCAMKHPGSYAWR